MMRVSNKLWYVGLAALLFCAGALPAQAQQGEAEYYLAPGTSENSPPPRLGFTGRMLYGRGMLVEDVVPGSLAEQLGLESGDIILRINGNRVQNNRDYRRAMAEAAYSYDGRITLFVDNVRARSGDPTAERFVSVRGQLDTGSGPSVLYSQNTEGQ